LPAAGAVRRSGSERIRNELVAKGARSGSIEVILNGSTIVRSGAMWFARRWRARGMALLTRRSSGAVGRLEPQKR
jgi:hypothetical protein